MTMVEPAATIGIVLRRSPRQLAAEPFYGELIAGLEEVLETRGLQLLLQVVDDMPRELESYRRWVATGAVRAAVLTDLVPDDPRPALLTRLGLTGIILGEPVEAVDLPAARTAGYVPMGDAVRRLAALGHVRIARVSGPSAFVHTQDRTRGYLDATHALGLIARIEEGDYSAESGAAAVRRLLALPDAPTAIIFDNDTMAIAGLATAQGLGVDVPGELSILAWDDSQLCQLTTPPLSAMSQDVHARGMLAAHILLAALDGAAPGDVFTEPPVFVERGTTARVAAVERSADSA